MAGTATLFFINPQAFHFCFLQELSLCISGMIDKKELEIYAMIGSATGKGEQEWNLSLRM